jgi:putative tyrosine kinase-like protein
MEEKKQYNDDEISLKDIILKGQEYFQYLLRNWIWILIPVVIFVSYKIYQTYSTPPKYEASLTFILNNNQSSPTAGLSSLLGSFGFGGGSTSGFNASTLVDMALSHKIIQAVLITKTEIGGKQDYLANHIIREYNLHKKWEEDDSRFKGFLFQHDSISQFNLIENAIIKLLRVKLLGFGDEKSLVMFSNNEETGILTLNVETTSQELSLNLTNILYDKLKDFYIIKTTQPQIRTFNLMGIKTDSLFQELKQKEYNLANFKDTNRNLWTRKDLVDQSRMEREVQILTLMYGESVKNREYADFSLKSALPSIESIDRPIAPLRPVKPSYLINIVFGILLGGFIGAGFLIFRKLYLDIMNSD